MRLRIQREQLAALKDALAAAREREIGGQLFGEQLRPSEFRASDLTIQRRRGSFARFIVDLAQAARDAATFFAKTAKRYERFNYIGEWHSHPSFAVRPSSTDIATMRSLVADRDFNGTFATLMIVRLDGDRITCGAWVFDPAGRIEPVSVEVEQ